MRLVRCARHIAGIALGGTHGVAPRAILHPVKVGHSSFRPFQLHSIHVMAAWHAIFGVALGAQHAIAACGTRLTANICPALVAMSWSASDLCVLGLEVAPLVAGLPGFNMPYFNVLTTSGTFLVCQVMGADGNGAYSNIISGLQW